MSFFKTMLAAFTVMTCLTVMGVDPRARVDIDGRKGKVSMKIIDSPEGGVAGNAEWAGADKPYYLVTQGPAIDDDDWQDYSFSFMPEKDGDILIRWAGYFYRPDGEMKNIPVWTCYDDITVTGAIVENCNFEEEDADGMPQGWGLYVKDQFIRENGNKYVKAWHNQPAICVIHVIAGQPVKIKVKVKRLEE